MSTPTQRAVLLSDVERKARADLEKCDRGALIDWVFRHARAVVRLAEAEQAWKAFDADRYRLQLTRSSGAGDDYDALVMVTASLHSAAADLGEARAIEVACAHVVRMLEALPVQQQQTTRPSMPTLPKKAA